MFRIRYLYFILIGIPTLLKGNLIQDSFSNFIVLFLFKCPHNVENMTACFLDFPGSVTLPYFLSRLFQTQVR